MKKNSSSFSILVWVFIEATLLTLRLPSAQAIPEVNYPQNYNDLVLPLLKKAQNFTFNSYDQYLLHGVHFIHPKPLGTLVILPGRTEPYLKYAEVFYDFYQMGYEIYSYDLRGQGLNQHLVPQKPQMGHVEYFEDYVKDLECFIKSKIEPSVQNLTSKNKNIFLLAHSMSGTITALYLSKNPTPPFRAVSLSAPMFEINTKPYPKWLAYSLVKLLNFFSLGQHYTLGHDDADPNEPFTQPGPTHSEARFKMSKFVEQNYPQTLMGGASNRWVLEALKATNRVQEFSAFPKTPILLLQAEKDARVLPQAQDQYCNRSSQCKKIVLKNSFHEILMEEDSIRQKALAETHNFFNQF